MEQDILTFTKGLMPQLGQTMPIPGSYLDALNMMRDEAGNPSNEIGTKEVVNLGNFKVIGHYLLGEDIVLISVYGTTTNIGVLDINDNYTVYASSSELDYTTDTVLSVEGRINHKGERIVYVGGKGIKLRIFNLETLLKTHTVSDKESALFMEYFLPQVEYVSVADGGKVLSGVYQFAVRFVTSSNNTTAFGTITQPIPIGLGSSSANRKDYDGADPQTLTSKLINLKVTNVDSLFDYVEPCVVTYVGEANVVVARSLGKIPISGRDTINFTYSGASSEVGDILESELSIDATSYVSGNSLVQKDNTLIISGVTEEENKTDWQKVANKIKVRWVEHDLLYDETIVVRNGNGERMGEMGPNIMHGEADFVGATWLMGSIKMWDSDASGTFTEVGTGGTLQDYKNPINAAKFKTYKRGEVYSFTFTPLFTNGRRGNAYHIPALNKDDAMMLDAATVPTLTYPSEYGSPLAGTPIRYHRMPNQIESPIFKRVNNQQYIVALGLEFDLPETIEGEDWTKDIAGYIIGREDRTGKETLIGQGFIQGIYQSGFNGNDYVPIPGFGQTYVRGVNKLERRGNTKDHHTQFIYHAPDFIFDKQEFIPKNLIRVNSMKCYLEYANTGNQSNFNMACLAMAEPHISKHDVIGTTGAVKRIVTDSLAPETDNTWDMEDGVDIKTPIFDGNNLCYKRIQDCIVMETTQSYPQTMYSGVDFFEDAPDGKVSRYFLYENRFTDFDINLYDIEIYNDILYGDVHNKSAMPIATVIFEKGTKDPRTGNTLNSLKPIAFAGDTFISRVAYDIKTTIAMFESRHREQDIPRSSALVYLFVESKNNYNYRHIRYEDDGTYSVPYFPKHRTLSTAERTGLLDLPVLKGRAEMYNKQYSAGNKLQANYTKDIDEEEIVEFTNRVIYSATSTEGERFDAFRLFLPGNYHDIPKQYGKLTSGFVHANELYFHAENSLWRAFYNTLATQVTSEGDIVLGNGGAFNRPSVPLLTIDGGYAGCTHLLSTLETPIGRFFYDSNKAKVYLLSEGLNEISNPNIFGLLRQKLHKVDVVLGYDYGRKRLLISHPNLTLSYKPELSSFESRHSYNFGRFVSRDLTDYLLGSSLVHKFDIGSVGKYFGTNYDSMIKVGSVVHPNISKRYVSTETTLVATSMNGTNLPFEFLDRFSAYSLERHTGPNKLRVIREFMEDLETLGNVFVHKANNKFRFAIPPDIVYDINVDTTNPTNWITHSRFSNEDRILLPDMIDNHMVFEVWIDNINKQKMVRINSFIINFDKNLT